MLVFIWETPERPPRQGPGDVPHLAARHLRGQEVRGRAHQDRRGEGDRGKGGPIFTASNRGLGVGILSLLFLFFFFFLGFLLS